MALRLIWYKSMVGGGRLGEILDAERLRKNIIVNKVRSLLLPPSFISSWFFWNYAFSSTPIYQTFDDSHSLMTQTVTHVFFSLLQTHHYTNRLVLDLSFLISSPKTFSHTSILSLLLRSHPGPCHQLQYTNSNYTTNFSSLELTLIYSHYTFLMFTLESQAHPSITFSHSISISPIYIFLPIQIISGGP